MLCYALHRGLAIVLRGVTSSLFFVFLANMNVQEQKSCQNFVPLPLFDNLQIKGSPRVLFQNLSHELWNVL